MTAQVTRLAIAQGDVDETIRRTVKALIKGNGRNVETVAPAVDMAVATLYRRLAKNGDGREFKASEVAALAAYFDVEVEDLYSGLDGRLLPPTTPSGGVLLPRLDSNQQPSAAPYSQVMVLPTAA